MQEGHDTGLFLQVSFTLKGTWTSFSCRSSSGLPIATPLEAMPGILITELMLWTSSPWLPSVGTCPLFISSDSGFKWQLRHLRFCIGVTVPVNQKQLHRAPPELWLCRAQLPPASSSGHPELCTTQAGLTQHGHSCHTSVHSWTHHPDPGLHSHCWTPYTSNRFPRLREGKFGQDCSILSGHTTLKRQLYNQLSVSKLEYMTLVQSDVKIPGEWIKRAGQHTEAASFGTQ